jgi:hypothetical protein
MTDRIRTLLVILDNDYRDDDVEVIKQSIAMIHGVSRVDNGEVLRGEEAINRMIIRDELCRALIEFTRRWKTE